MRPQSRRACWAVVCWTVTCMPPPPPPVPGCRQGVGRGVAVIRGAAVSVRHNKTSLASVEDHGHGALASVRL